MALGMKTTLAVLTTVLAFTSLVSCNALIPRQTLTCDQIIEGPLQVLDFDSLNRDNFRAWVTTTYGIPQSNVVIEEYAPEDIPSSRITAISQWNTGNKTYRADFLGEELRRIEVRWNSDKPRGSDIINCLGAPTMHLAYYLLVRQPSLDFQLWYPEQGVVVRHFAAYQSLPQITDSVQMHYLLLTRPASTEAMVRDTFVGNSERIQHEISSLLKPWPGSWEAISIDIDPRLHPK